LWLFKLLKELQDAESLMSKHHGRTVRFQLRHLHPDSITRIEPILVFRIPKPEVKRPNDYYGAPSDFLKQLDWRYHQIFGVKRYNDPNLLPLGGGEQTAARDATLPIAQTAAHEPKMKDSVEIFMDPMKKYRHTCECGMVTESSRYSWAQKDRPLSAV